MKTVVMVVVCTTVTVPWILTSQNRDQAIIHTSMLIGMLTYALVDWLSDLVATTIGLKVKDE